MTLFCVCIVKTSASSTFTDEYTSYNLRNLKEQLCAISYEDKKQTHIYLRERDVHGLTISDHFFKKKINAYIYLAR